MSQYQYVKGVEVCLNNHEVYHSKEDVMEQIKENEKEIQRRRMWLFGLVCSSDAASCVGDDGSCDSPIDMLQERFDNAFDDEFIGIETLVAHNVKLQYIYDNFERTEVG